MFSDFVVLQDGQLSNSLQNETLSKSSMGSGAALPARTASNPSHQVFSFCLNVTIDRAASIAADSVHCRLPLIFKCSFFLSRSELKRMKWKTKVGTHCAGQRPMRIGHQSFDRRSAFRMETSFLLRSRAWLAIFFLRSVNWHKKNGYTSDEQKESNRR